MSSAQQSNTTDSSGEGNVDLNKELAHITQEMYKKNFELADKNKTLALLRKIDEIILSSVTDTNQIAQQVADIVANEAEFKAVIMYLLDKSAGAFVKLAVSQTELIKNYKAQFNKNIFPDRISLILTHHLMIHVYQNKQMAITHNLQDIISSEFTLQQLPQLNQFMQIKSSIFYPLIIRNEVIGVMVICLGDTEESLFEFQKELVGRLANVIGIAIDNALLYQRIEVANEKLKQVDELKDEFVSLASHELRTPMTVIKSYIWMVINERGGPVTQKQKFYLDRALTSTDRLISFVNDMLNVSRIESNRLTIKITPADIQKLSEEIVSELEPRAKELEISITVVPNVSLVYVLVDQDKIREVFTNLIGNAFKFTPKGGHITVSFYRTDGMVEVHIADTGIGISKEDQKKLFQKFGMVGGNYLIRQNAQGTGLGLYLTKSIIELHGGKIWVQSAGIGQGTTFIFTLPVADNEKNNQLQIKKSQS